MPDPRFFARFGVFARPGFLTAEECSELRREIRRVGRDAATLRMPGREDAVRADVRDTQWADVQPDTERRVEARVAALRDEIAAHFDIGLEGIRGLRFLVYEPGGFFRPHADNSAESVDAPRARKISVVLFLNDQAADGTPAAGADPAAEATFRGGALTFYGLLGDPEAEGVGLPMRPRAGTLVAFRSEIVHGVEPVTAGERYTIVCWFY